MLLCSTHVLLMLRRALLAARGRSVAENATLLAAPPGSGRRGAQSSEKCNAILPARDSVRRSAQSSEKCYSARPGRLSPLGAM